MPRDSDEQVEYPALKATLPGLFKELASDGALWADAELALARAEAGVLLRRYAMVLALGCVAFAAMIAAILILAQAGVAALLPYVNGQASANLIVGVVLLGFVLLMAFAANYLLARKIHPVSRIFRWLAGTNAQNGASK
jgi:ABC-type Na+ efflux pump permease subunit